MSQSNNIQYKIYNIKSRGFTLVEVAAALVLLGLLLGSTLALMNRYIDTVMNYRLREQAFELARSNMELLLSENSLSDMDEYGTDEFNPDLDWETLVEPFYEPVTNQMWIRAVCTAGFTDTAGERQDIELEHWITNLTAEQVKQIVAQQKAEKEFMDLLQGGELTDLQKATVAFLLQEKLDTEAYRKFLKGQLRKKMEYLSKNGMPGYDTLQTQLEQEENEFLLDLGMDFDAYNNFVQDFDPSTFDPTSFELVPQSKQPAPADSPDTPGAQNSTDTSGSTEDSIPADVKNLLPPEILNALGNSSNGDE